MISYSATVQMIAAGFVAFFVPRYYSVHILNFVLLVSCVVTWWACTAYIKLKFWANFNVHFQVWQIQVDILHCIFLAYFAYSATLKLETVTWIYHTCNITGSKMEVELHMDQIICTMCPVWSVTYGDIQRTWLHTNYIWLHTDYIQITVTYRLHTTTYEWHMHYIQITYTTY
jgi:hypothetical protein